MLWQFSGQQKPRRQRTPINLSYPTNTTRRPAQGMENDMSNPDWTEAPDQATHYDCNADVFCTVDGWWSCKGKFCAMSAHFDWNTPRYTPRPVEPATTTWDGTGLPPVGSDQTVFVPSTAISAVGAMNSDSRWEVVAHRGDSVVVCIDEYGRGEYRASMVPARYCRHIPTQAQIDRTQLVKTLNQLRGETDMGVIADAIIEMGFRITKP